MLRLLRLTLLPLLLGCGLSAGANELLVRESFGVEASRGLDAVVPQLYSGARLEWFPKIALVMPDQSRQALRLVGHVTREEADGYTFVVPIERTDGEREVARAIDAFEVPPDRSITEIVAFKTTRNFVVTAMKRASLNDAAAITRAVRIAAATESSAAAWPTVLLTYKAFYGAPEWVGMLEWDSAVSTETMSVVHRLPGFVAKAMKGGAKLTDRAFIVVHENDAFDVYSREQARFIMSCAVPCTPDGKVVLGLWGPTTAAVGVTSP